MSSRCFEMFSIKPLAIWVPRSRSLSMQLNICSQMKIYIFKESWKWFLSANSLFDEKEEHVTSQNNFAATAIGSHLASTPFYQVFRSSLRNFLRRIDDTLNNAFEVCTYCRSTKETSAQNDFSFHPSIWNLLKSTGCLVLENSFQNPKFASCEN